MELFEPEAQNTEYRVQSTEYRVQSAECRVQSTEYRVQSTDTQRWHGMPFWEMAMTKRKCSGVRGVL